MAGIVKGSRTKFPNFSKFPNLGKHCFLGIGH